MHVDNNEIQKIGSNFHVLGGSTLTPTTLPGRKFGLFHTYGVAATCRLLKSVGLFCKRDL